MSDSILTGNIINTSQINVGLANDKPTDINVNLGNTNQMNVEIANKKTSINVQIVGTGPQGSKGDTGSPGLDTYQLWISQGNVGTLEDFFRIMNYEVSADSVVETSTRRFINQEDIIRMSGYTHVQIVASKEWVIHHPLNKQYVSVTVIDTGGNAVIGDIKYVNSEQIIITFSAEFSGKAYLM